MVAAGVGGVGGNPQHKESNKESHSLSLFSRFFFGVQADSVSFPGWGRGVG